MRANSEAPTEQELEKKFIYRVLKAAYVVSVFVSILIFIGYGFSFSPKSAIDTNKSHVVCNSGRIINYDNARFRSEENLRSVCVYGLDDYLYKSIPMSHNYNWVRVNKIQGSFVDVFTTWILGSFLSFFVLSVLREALVYVFFGKPVTWKGIKSLLLFRHRE